MKKRFELWTEYQEIMFEPRRFVGCSVYELSQGTKNLLKEIYSDPVSIYDNPKNQEIGRNLGELVLKQFEYNPGDEIGTIDQRVSSGLRSIESLLFPIFYSTSREPIEVPGRSPLNYQNELTFAKGFIEYLSRTRH